MLDVLSQFNLSFWPPDNSNEPAPTTPTPSHSECKSLREIDFWCKQRIGLDDLHDGDAETYFRNPVTVAHLGGARYVMANYRQIVSFDMDTHVSFVVPHDWGGRFNPNGLTYDAQWQRLYVANFQGNDVLVFDVLEDSLAFREQILTDEQPKSTALHENLLAVACELGETVQLFDVSVSPAEMLWRVEIGPVHGITIYEGHVYVTDLPSRRLIKLELQTGEYVDEVTGFGFAEDALEFIWPTSLAVHDHQLLLSDGLRGTMFLIDPDTLEREDSFGHQGPTDRFLLMPYGAISVEGKIVVASTGQDRIVFLQPDGPYLCAETSVGAKSDDWDYARQSLAPRADPIGKDWQWPAWRGGEPLELFGGQYDPGFRYLSRRGTTPAYPVAIYICHPETAFARDYLFTTVARFGTDYLFVSHASDVATYWGTHEGIPYYLPMRIPRRCWVLDNELYGPRGPVDLVDMKDTIDGVVTTLTLARHENGWLSFGDYLEAAYGHEWSIREILEDRIAKFWVLPPPVDESALRRLLERCFTSPAGMEFWQHAKDFDEATASEDIELAAAEYFDAARDYPAQYMDEYYLVAMFCGVAVPSNP